MKKTFLNKCTLCGLLLLSLLHGPSYAYCQQKFACTFDKVELSHVLKQLSSDYKFKFSFDPKQIEGFIVEKKINTSSEATLISELFDGLPFTIQLSDGIYLLIPTPQKPLPLTGQISDFHSGEPLAYAFIQSTSNETVSNLNGVFTLPPRSDTLELVISYLGYDPLLIEVPPQEKSVQLKMQQNAQELQEVILNSPKVKAVSQEPSFFSLNPKKFSALPVLGETDVFKCIQLLPGVSATDETSSGLSVRGGTPSQNLVLMDGFTIYNLDHVFGIFSTINPHMINNVAVYKGGFGPRYGGRSSSVVDIQGKSGSPDAFHVGGGANLLSLHGYLEAPFSTQTSALLGFRQSFTGIINSDLYKDFLASNRQNIIASVDSEVATLDILPSLTFYDFNGKVRHRFSDKSLLDINLYSSQDEYDGRFFDEDDLKRTSVTDQSNWGNDGMSIQWQTQWKPNWFGHFIVSLSSMKKDEGLTVDQTFFEEIQIAFYDTTYNDSLDLEIIETFIDSVSVNETIDLFNYQVNSSISDVSIKSHHEFTLNQYHQLYAGAELNRIATRYLSEWNSYGGLVSEEFRDSLALTADILSFYGRHLYQNNKVSLSIGARLTHYETTNKWYVEPRWDGRYALSDQLSLKAAASIHRQYVSQTTLSFFQNTEQFYWVLADDKSIPVQQSKHLIAGLNYSTDHWNIDAEIYRKKTTGIMENQFEYEIVDNLSKGIDLFLKYSNPKFNGWVSYSLGSSTHFYHLDTLGAFPSAQDQRHELNIGSILKIKKLELSTIYLYGSGKPYTPSNPSFNILSDNEVYDLSAINGSRLPAYKRLDVSAKYSFQFGSVACETGITLFNILNYRNLKSRSYTIQYTYNEEANANVTDDEANIAALDTHLLGFTPNLFINFRF